MEPISVEQAAEKLGISGRQVRRLAEAGEISARRIGGRWAIDAEAVRRRSRSAVMRGRPLSPRIAWTVLALLGSALDDRRPDSDVVQIDDRRVRHRVRRLLANAPSPQQWGFWLRNRAEPRSVWVHPGVVDRLAADERLHAAGGSVLAASGVGITPGQRRIFYVGGSAVEAVLADYRAEPLEDGPVVLMVVPSDVPSAVLGDAGEPVDTAVALVDLLSSPDARERHVAAEELGRVGRIAFAGPSASGDGPS